MKKILCLILCLVMACSLLISCSDSQIGDYLKNYPEQPETVGKLALNMYIIVGDNTTENAKTTVKRMISQHTVSDYNTELNVFYVSESEYETTVMSAINNGGENAPHIILINSESMLNSLYKSDSDTKLADLTAYYASRDYGRLNTQIATSLIQSSKLGENNKLYTVPNNHVVDEYTYLVIDEDVAHQTLHYPSNELNSYKSLEEAAELKNKMTLAGYNADELVYEISGPYELKAELEAAGNFCNIIKYPIATAAEVFSSSFAIVNTEAKYNDRAMQMIYAINTDVYLRNLLQYGVMGTNYSIVNGDIVRISEGENVYDMNLKYTGDIFKAEFCSELKWTETAYNNGIIQNKNSVAAEKNMD